MIPKLVLLTLGSAAAMGLAGCFWTACPERTLYTEEAYVQVQAEPPPLRVDVMQPPAPTATAVWVGGHWDWRGTWVWVPGYWDQPRPGWVWTAPVAVPNPAGGYRYHPGHWRPQSVEPPPVYRRPDAIPVAVPVQPPHAQAVPVQPPHAQAVPVQPPHAQAVPVQPVYAPRPQVTPAGPIAGGVVNVAPVSPPVIVAPTPRTPPVIVAPTPTPSRPPVVVTPAPAPIPPPVVAPSTVPVRPVTPAGPVVVQPTPVLPPGVRPAVVGVSPTSPQITGSGTTPSLNPSAIRPQVTGVTGAGGATIGAPPTVAPRITGTVGATVGPPAAAMVALQCSVATPRVPGGGLVTINGQGFGAAIVVRIGGNVAAIVRRNPTQLQVQVARGSSGGSVTMTADGQTAQCGGVAVVH